MTKMGRPKSKTPKHKIITMRLDEKHYNEIKIYAETHNMTVTNLLKEGLKKVMT